MCPWKVDAIQKSVLSKRFLDSKNSIVSDSILLFVEKLHLDDPYNKMFTSLQWFNKVSSRLLSFFEEFRSLFGKQSSFLESEQINV